MYLYNDLQGITPARIWQLEGLYPKTNTAATAELKHFHIID